MQRRVSAFLALGLSLLAVGCTSDQKSASDIGSVHVAVLSRTGWDDYKSELQPHFDITPDKALSDSIADTAQFEQAMLDSFRAALALKLAPSAALPGGFGTGKSGDGFSATVSAAATQPSVSPPVSILDKTGLKNDPFLQYQAATALYQEVKLLGRYIEDAAIRNAYRAYVVRMQISVMPKRRGQPYDTYVDLGFFLNGFAQEVSAAGMSLPSPGGINPMWWMHPMRLPSEAKTRLNVLETSLKKLRDDNSADPQKIKDLEAELNETQKLVNEQANASRAVENARGKLSWLVKEFNARTGSTDKAIQSNIAHLKALRDSLTPYAHVPAEADDVSNVVAEIDLQLNKLYDFQSQLLYKDTSPLVVPLLVTDEVEAAIASRRAEHLQQLSLALAAAYAGIGGQASIDSIQQAVRNALGRDYNSLFSVGRVNDNSVRIRIGARQTGAIPNAKDLKSSARSDMSYEIVPQTHCVSLLLLVPNGLVENLSADVSFGAHMSFIDARTGVKVGTPSMTQSKVKDQLFKAYGAKYADLLRIESAKESSPTSSSQSASLPTLSAPALAHAAETEPSTTLEDSLELFLRESPSKSESTNKAVRPRLIRRDVTNGSPGSLDPKDVLYSAAMAAQNSSYERFLDVLHANAGSKDTGLANALWLDLATAHIGSSVDSGSFSLPVYRRPGFDSMEGKGTVVLIDDGKQTVGTVGGGHGLDPLNMNAVWSFSARNSDGGSSTSEAMQLLATKVDVNGPETKLTFPSLKAAGIKPAKPFGKVNTRNGESGVAIAYDNGSDAKNGLSKQSFSWVYRQTEAQLPSVGSMVINRGKLGPTLPNRSDEVDVIITLDEAFNKGLKPPATKPATGDDGTKIYPALSVDGATVMSVTCVSANPAKAANESSKNKGTWLITESGRFRVALQGLVPKTDVTFSLSAPTGYTAPKAVSKSVDDLPAH